MLLSCSQAGQIVGAADAELPLPQNFQLHFNHRDSGRYQSPLTGQWRNGDNLEEQLIRQIHTANEEVLMAIQELTLPQIAKALIRAKKRGVRVQVVLENNYSRPWSEQHPSDLSAHGRRRHQQLQLLADSNRDGRLTAEERLAGDAIALLKRAGVAIIDDTEDGSRGSGLMHHKFLVVDQSLVITGSANFTSSGMHGDAGAARSRGNVNHLLSIRSPELAGLFREEFERMWGDGPGGEHNSRFGRGKTSPGIQAVQVNGIQIDVLFAPHSKQFPGHGLELITEQLAAAKQSIDMALFVFSAQTLTNVLAKRMAAGIDIRLLADPGFASRSFSEVLDLLGLELPDRFCKLEAGNQPLKTPLQTVGSPRLARGDKLHHKFAVFDNKTVITGSFNWSPAAAHTNDETLLVIHSPKIAEHFTREMDRMWRGAELGITPHIQRKLERQRAKCGRGLQRY
ncbi:phosphatidylserine/phosphatidylglycerophosphate/cardiolipin synthase family protein [Synechococcus sp. BIOS-E4-1]|uniref:phospholipase D-like domain-containing protein n=1 Tax=Synechococcus sp. BIOS-E4-1 TaxID=1400864 RepID=UPI00164607A4|nr:phospholipase D-like domain-containing protein [Synechococcus sp. BIOS-E4-1]